ncbi:hypothetical protein [Nocardia arthritidis]|uniref:hypothetical protein n=1 Tax=Nocardia arthritidis TaxID=228602 RepID=UPI000A582868|nr:hypothetical protein [Nocardia arthritidis]
MLFFQRLRRKGAHPAHTTDLLVDVDGDRVAASANSLVYFFREGQPPHQTSGLRMACTVVRTPAGRRLRKTRIMLAWTRKD